MWIWTRSYKQGYEKMELLSVTLQRLVRNAFTVHDCWQQLFRLGAASKIVGSERPSGTTATLGVRLRYIALRLQQKFYQHLTPQWQEEPLRTRGFRVSVRSPFVVLNPRRKLSSIQQNPRRNTCPGP